jgi:hypothetical protein
MTLRELVEAFTSRWDIPDLDIIKELKRRLPQIEAAVELAEDLDIIGIQELRERFLGLYLLGTDIGDASERAIAALEKLRSLEVK